MNEQPPGPSTARHVIVVGCGRVGAGIAERLVAAGDSVAVVDIDARSFRRLGDLDAQRIEGFGYDRETLIAAGVRGAFGLAAVTDGDNTNIVVARTARENFGVERVFARIYDPRRAAIYERMGIPTIPSASLAIEMSLRQLTAGDEHVVWSDPTGEFALVEMSVGASLAGQRIGDATLERNETIVALRRLGRVVVPATSLVLQDGDVVTVTRFGAAHEQEVRG